MLEKDNSPRSILVRITGSCTLIFLLGFIISLIVTIASGSENEDGEILYPDVGLAFNFLFAIGFLFFFILFLFLYIQRFIKRVKGPALKMKPREEFKDDLEAGSFVEEVNISSIDYLSFFYVSFHTFKKDIIVLSLTSLLSLALALSLYIQQIQINLAYALFVLFAVSFLIALSLLFLMPFSERKKHDTLMPKSIIIYQDRFSYPIKDQMQDFTYSMCHKSYILKNSVIFIFYRDGEKRFIFPKDCVSPSTYPFLLLKANQVKNNN